MSNKLEAIKWIQGHQKIDAAKLKISFCTCHKEPLLTITDRKRCKITYFSVDSFLDMIEKERGGLG